MKKYYYKNGSKVYSNDPNIEGAKEVKVIYNCSDIINKNGTDSFFGGAAPWFCIKDGSMPFVKGDSFKTISGEGGNIITAVDVVSNYRRIFSCTQDCLTYAWAISNETNWIGRRKVPMLEKKELYVGKESVINVLDRIDEQGNIIGNKLSWKISPENMRYYPVGGGPFPVPNFQDDATSSYNFKSGYQYKNLNNFIGLGNETSTNYGDFYNYWTVYYPPKTVENTEYGFTTAQSNSASPSYFTLDIRQVPKEYTKIEVAIDGVFYYPYDNYNGHTTYVPDNPDTKNILNAYNFGEPLTYPTFNCWAYLYKPDNNTVWTYMDNNENPRQGYDYLGNAFFGNIAYKPELTGTNHKTPFYNIDTHYDVRTDAIYDNSNVRYSLSDPKLWENMFLYQVNTNNDYICKFEVQLPNDETVTGYTFWDNLSAVSMYNISITAYSAENTTEDSMIRIRDILTSYGKQFYSATFDSDPNVIDYRQYFNTNDNYIHRKLKDLNCNWGALSSRFKIFGAVPSYNNPNTLYLYQGLNKGDYYINSYGGVDMLSNCLNEPGNYLWNPYGFTLTAFMLYYLSNVKMTHTIDLGERTDTGGFTFGDNTKDYQYLHITYPATNTINGSATLNLISQIDMYYKFTN
jgi:hypothetical protein